MVNNLFTTTFSGSPLPEMIITHCPNCLKRATGFKQFGMDRFNCYCPSCDKYFDFSREDTLTVRYLNKLLED